MSKVGDVIECGKSIPEDATALKDTHGYVWAHRPTGWWGPRAQSLPGDLLVDKFAPLTVTAVREPDPDDVVHYRIPGDASALTLCGVDVWDESTIVTERAGSSNCAGCRAAADERPKSHTVRVMMPLGIDDRDGKAVISGPDGEIGSCDRQVFLDLIAKEFGVRITAQSTDDEPEALLDLVRQYGKAKEATGGEAASGATTRALEHAATSDALFDRIASAAETARLSDIIGAKREEVGSILLEMQPLVLSLPQVPEGAVALLGGITGDRYERRGEEWTSAEWTGRLADLLLYELELTVVMRKPRTDLPCGHPIESSKFEDHDGAKVLITVPSAHDNNGDAFTTPLAWCAQGHGWLSLTAEEFAEVTEASEEKRREPRTWPKLDGAPDDLARFKGASGKVWRRGDGGILLWCWEDHAGILHGFQTFAEIQHGDGPLTEVIDQ